MTDDFRIDVPFETKPPRLKDLINSHVMGDVWVRDTPFGPVTDSLRIAENLRWSISMLCELSRNA